MPSTTWPIVSWTWPDVGAAADQLAGAAVAAVTRGAGGDEVADAGQAGERGEVGAQAHAEARDLGEAAGHERRPRVVAEAEAVGDADGDGDGVLGGAAELDADHVVVGVHAQGVAGDDRAAGAAPGASSAPAMTVADGMSREISSAWLGPDSAAAAAPVSLAITSVGRSSVCSSRPLASESCRRRPAARRGAPSAPPRARPAWARRRRRRPEPSSDGSAMATKRISGASPTPGRNCGLACAALTPRPRRR